MFHTKSFVKIYLYIWLLERSISSLDFEYPKALLIRSVWKKATEKVCWAGKKRNFDISYVGIVRKLRNISNIRTVCCYTHLASQKTVSQQDLLGS